MRKRRPIITPPREFGFTAETFNLFAEVTQDGERVAREQAERAQAEQARRDALRNHPTLTLDPL
jgi:hypothetical protein